MTNTKKRRVTAGRVRNQAALGAVYHFELRKDKWSPDGSTCELGGLFVVRRCRRKSSAVRISWEHLAAHYGAMIPLDGEDCGVKLTEDGAYVSVRGLPPRVLSFRKLARQLANLASPQPELFPSRPVGNLELEA